MTRTLHTFVCVCVLYSPIISSTKVTTKYGEIQGLNENGVSKFLGIPYATPTRVYDGPSTLSNFTGTYNATAFKPACPQDERVLHFVTDSLYGNLTKHLNIPTNFTEDCLYLNVYVPGPINSNNTLPVMVYIHGGYFQFGSGQIFDPTELVKIGTVIVVTFNYKLGVLGFLPFLNNTGLWNQIHALKWVQENIKNFGGDPNMVTIFGEGSGGIAVGWHVVSLESRGLFKRAISMGGTAFQTEVLDMDPENITQMFMKEVNCSSSSNMRECIKNLPEDEILQAQTNLDHQRRIFLPIIDGKFLPASPQVLIETGQFSKVDYIIGLNNDAGTASNVFLLGQLINGTSKEQYLENIHNLVMAEYKSNYQVILDTVAFEYRPILSTDDYSENQLWLRQYLTILRDTIASQCHATQLYHAGFGGKVYAYYFDQIPPFSEHSHFMLMAASGMEMAYVFGLQGNDSLSHQIMQSWSNFAAKGDPYLSTENGPWSQFNATSKLLVQFSNKFNHSSKILNDYPGKIEKRLSLWTELLPALQEATPSCDQRPPADNDSGSVIKLKQGLLRGERIQAGGYAWEQFMGIPYAEPPLGALRWNPPKPHTGWHGVRNSSRDIGKACPQMTRGYYAEEGEDCLYLDIFVPYGVKYVRYQKLPVMFFIHGGGYVVGSKLEYHGAALAQYDVIVVVVQYRLGVLGFLSTGDKAAPGNYGLMDQNLAIRWTRDNIDKFGGDPNKITIFGESAGAASAMLQMISPKSKALFKNVIAQSGSTFTGWALDRYDESIKLALAVGNRSHCPNDNSQLMVECLRRVPWEDITRMSEEEQLTFPAPRPVIDGDFLHRYPEEVYQEKATREFNVMTGTLKDEGYVFLFSGAPLLIRNANTNNKEALAAALKYTYFAATSMHDTNSTEYQMALNDAMTDCLFAAGADRDAKLHSQYGGKTYRYFIKFRPSFSLIANNASDWVQGTHADDIPYVFGWPELWDRGIINSLPQYKTLVTDAMVLYNITFVKKDFAFSRNVMTLWTNFARTGDPNKGVDLRFNWPLFSEDHPSILFINENLTQFGYDPIITSSSAPDLLRPDKLAFWNELVPSLDFQTLPPCPGTTDGGTETVTVDIGETVTEKPTDTPTKTLTDTPTDIPTTDKPNEPVACNPEIGLLKITGDQANTALWVLGIACGVLLLMVTVTCCNCMSIKKKYTKLATAREPLNGYDNIAMQQT